jgi:beta-phosphoglucomutase
MAIKGIIFDMDGVIIDSERLHDIVAHSFFNERGIQYDRDTVKPMLMGKSSREVAAIQKEYYNLPDSLEDIVRIKSEKLDMLLEEQLVYIPWFLEYHTYITSLWLQSVVATWSSARIVAKVDEKLGIKGIFWKNIITVDQVWNIGKPDPAIFLGAAKLIGLDPQECLIIEDAPNGIMAAKAAWSKVIGLATTLTREQLEIVSPDYIVDWYDEIREITATLLAI